MTLKDRGKVNVVEVERMAESAIEKCNMWRSKSPPLQMTVVDLLAPRGLVAVSMGLLDSDWTTTGGNTNVIKE
jgi:hypothetical protein